MNISRRTFITALGASVVLPFLPGCPRAARPLTIASHIWPGYEFMFLARREGWLPQEGVSLLETSSATSSIQALREGKADGAALTLDEVLRVRGDGIPLTVVLVFDVSSGADAVLARPGINKPEDLAGKRIGYEKTALGALMFHKLLEAAHLPAQAVIQVPLAVDHHLQSWNEERLDAVVTYEPWLTKLEAVGAHRIFDSFGVPGVILDVLAVRTNAIHEHAQALTQLVQGHFRGLHHLKTNRQDAVYRIAPRLGISAQRVLDAFRGLELPDIQTNRGYLGGSNPKIITAARTLNDFMPKAGLLRKEDGLADICSDRFLPVGELP